MIKDLTKVTKEDIKKSAKEAVDTPIIATQGDMEVYSNALYALHTGKEVVNASEEILKQNNFDERNIESVDRLIEEPMPERVGMFVNESGKSDVKISEKSRKIVAEALLR